MVFVYKITALIIVFCLFDYAELSKCTRGWHPGYKGNCYLFSRFSAPFYSAMSFCQTIGGKLVEIDNYWEYKTLLRMARNRRFPPCWIGITDMYSEGAWQKATTQESQRYFRWRSGEPNSHGGQENCVAMDQGDGKWNDGSCTVHLPFICEK
ncbi:hepatic lectin-like [Mytilus trossulus]|uniref:hepatic lectin-like n=1 Tax=Mytilus trossulus TaxID=6551 RepID=UPI003003F7B8